MTRFSSCPECGVDDVPVQDGRLASHDYSPDQQCEGSYLLVPLEFCHLGERLSFGGMTAMAARAAIAFDRVECHLPGFIVGKTGERRESRVVTVEEYAWACKRCRARGVDYEDEVSALTASVRHQHAAHPNLATAMTPVEIKP